MRKKRLRETGREEHTGGQTGTQRETDRQTSRQRETNRQRIYREIKRFLKKRKKYTER